MVARASYPACSGTGIEMTDSLTRKGMQLDLDVWQEAKNRVSVKEKMLRSKAKPVFREVKMSEVIADAFVKTGWVREG